jgi:hypothetical protein
MRHWDCVWTTERPNNPRERAKKMLNKTILFLCLIISFAGTMYSADVNADAKGASLDEILTLANKSTETFLHQFKSVTCLEQVIQEKLGTKGKVENKQKTIYDYLVLLNEREDGLSVDESRLQQGKKSKTKNPPLLVTGGLPTLILAFHPSYRESFRYELAGDELDEGRWLMKIRFQHLPGTRSTTALRLRGKDYPLDIEGVAWIDLDAGAIYKIVAGISSPILDLNLKAFEMEVRYDPHTFAPDVETVWLPTTATAGIQTERQRWRNTHQYTKYRRFTVNAEDLVSR